MPDGFDRLGGARSTLGMKAPVSAASTANIALRSGELTVDGVALATGDRVLLKNQSSAAQNGIYIVDTAEWTRAVDFDGSTDFVKGTMVPVVGGSINAGRIYKVDTDGPYLIGETAIAFDGLFFPSDLSEISVHDFGAIGDDVADDGPAIQAALIAADGRTVRLQPGRTYRVATPIVTRGQSWTLDARSAKVHVDADISFLTAYADIDNLQNVSAIVGDDVTVANGSLFAVGDHVRVISEDVPTNGRTLVLSDGRTYKCGETATVKSIVGNVLTMTGTIRHDNEFITSRRIFRMPLEERVAIIGGEVYYTEGNDSTPWNADCILLYGFLKPRVEGLYISRGYAAGLVLVGTQGAFVADYRAERLTDNPSNSQFGYGLMDAGVDTIVLNITGGWCRHLLTTNPLGVPALTTNEDELHRYGWCRGLKVFGGSARSSSDSAFDTHHMTEDVLFDGLYAENCTFAINIRAQRCRVSNIVANGSAGNAIIQVFSESLASGGPATEAGWASDVYIENVVGDGVKAVSVIRAKDVHITNVKATVTRFRAFDLLDCEAFLHGAIVLTINDPAATDAGQGPITINHTDASFVPKLTQLDGVMRARGAGSSGSTSFAAIRADAADVSMINYEVIFPTGSVGPMLITANGGTIEVDMKFDISGATEAGMTLTSGSSISMAVQSADGTKDGFNWRRKAREPLKWPFAGGQDTATIASGVITATCSFMSVDTEAAAAADDLDTINGGLNGDVLILRTVNSGRDVTVKNGTGNIFCGSDRVLSNTADRIILHNANGNTWFLLSFADNAV